jgi:hypothetical protein
MKALFFKSVVLFAMFMFGFAQTGNSQTKQATEKKSTTALAQTNYCDQVIANTNKRLKEEANATCATQHTCVECTDRTTMMKIYATMVVQPDKPGCKVATEIAISDDAVSRGTETRTGFRAELLQSPCFAGGTNLEVFLPGYGQASREFSYLWEIDGGKGGHLPTIQCACGKEAKVKVTQLATGESITLVAKLGSTCGDSTKK